MCWVYGMLSGSLAGIAAGALAGAFLMLVTAALLGASAAGAAIPNRAFLCFEAVHAHRDVSWPVTLVRAIDRGWDLPVSVLVLYILRARRLNAMVMILLAFAFWMVIGRGSALTDAALGPGMTTIVFSVSACVYASISSSQDGYAMLPVYLHGMKLHRLAFATLVFSSLLSALIAAAPLLLLLLQGIPGSVVLAGVAEVLLAAYVSHLVMALIWPHLPLSEPIGTFSLIVIIDSLYSRLPGCVPWLFHISWPVLLGPLRTGWPLIGFYAAIAIPLTFALVRILARRLRYLIPGRERPSQLPANIRGRGGLWAQGVTKDDGQPVRDPERCILEPVPRRDEGCRGEEPLGRARIGACDGWAFDSVGE